MTQEALKQTQEPVALPCCGYADASAIKWNPYNQVVHCHNCGQIYTIPLQPEQEPVAWMFQHDETGRMNYVSNDGVHNPTIFLEMNPRYALVCPLYTTPPQRTWVGLTDEEIDSCFEDHGWSPSEDYYLVIKDIEAKLKEKNGA